MRGGEDSDEALVARAGRGDRIAAGALVMRHTDKIFAASLRMLGNRAAAEDVTQETFLRLWKNAGRWRSGEARIDTWLYKVAMNLCIDHQRKHRREAPGEAAPERADPAPRADDRLAASERQAEVAAAISTLPERQRMAITLSHFEELSNSETAEILGISIEAVESLLARGRRALKDRLVARRAELMEGMGHDASSLAL